MRVGSRVIVRSSGRAALIIYESPNPAAPAPYLVSFNDNHRETEAFSLEELDEQASIKK